jgi:hypothetical protein
MKKSPYNDKNGSPLNEGDLITGMTNFHTVQGIVTYDETGKDDYEKWHITIIKTLKDYKWHFNQNPYTLYLSYHLIDDTNNCRYYSKIENYFD